MKKSTNINLLLIVSIIFLLSGCAGWKNVSGVQKINSQKITLNLNDKNWHAFDDEISQMYTLTKDGVTLQQIFIKKSPLNKALLSSKKSIQKDILPHELAELIIEDLKLANEMKSFKVLVNKPDQIDSKDAVQIISQVKDEFDNLIKINSTYFIYDDSLYSLSYLAPNQYFYNKDIEKFQDIKKSIKLSL